MGLLSSLAFAPLFFFPILLISFSYFLLLIHLAKSKKIAFFTGWWFGFGFFLAGLYWISFALLVDINSFWWLIPFAILLIPAILATYVALVAFLAKLLSKNQYSLLVNFICLWVVAEIIRVNILTGFPWLLIGYSLCFSDYTIQLASVLGIYGLSFVGLFISCTPFLLLLSNKKRDFIWVILAILIFITNYGFGYMRLKEYPTTYTTTMIRVVQANIPQNLKWDYKETMNNLLKHINLSKQEHNKIDYVIWPESAIAFPLALQDRLMLGNILPKNSLLLSGGIRVDNANHPTSVWNTVFVINAQGEIMDFYDKTHLVPFGEYIPFKKFIPVTKITHGTLDYSSGFGLKRIKVSNQLPSFTPLICYEAYFPEKTIASGSQPDFIINFTNDAWYGNTSGPYQHLHMTRLRAVEQGIPIIRAANTGISAIIDSYGRILSELPLNNSGVIDTYLPDIVPRTTLYNKKNNKLIFYGIIIFFLISCKFITKLT
jgi:apolipoprotein N-acyltransferase